MREFFKGWRRKAGCGFLVLACTLAGAWVRGVYMHDGFSIRSDEWHDVISFSREGVTWERYYTPSNIASKYGRFGSGWRSLPSTNHKDFGECTWRWNWYVFDCGECRDKVLVVYRRAFWRIPYLPPACSLTLLSAYLILWKPRKRVNHA